MLTAFGIVIAGFFFLGVSFARQWIDLVAEEMIVCLDSGIVRSQCRSTAHRRMQVLPYGTLKRFTIRTGQGNNQLRIDFQIKKPTFLSFIGEKTWTISRVASGRQTRLPR